MHHGGWIPNGRERRDGWVLDMDGGTDGHGQRDMDRGTEGRSSTRSGLMCLSGCLGVCVSVPSAEAHQSIRDSSREGISNGMDR
jgi:hypothetical protein